MEAYTHICIITFTLIQSQCVPTQALPFFSTHISRRGKNTRVPCADCFCWTCIHQ